MVGNQSSEPVAQSGASNDKDAAAGYATDDIPKLMGPGAGEMLDGTGVKGPRNLAAVIGRLRSVAVFAIFVGLVVFFSIRAPGTFLTFADLQTILENSVVLTLVAAGVSIVLALGLFDLSFSAVIGLSGAVAVGLMHTYHTGAFAAVLAALAVGLVIGIVNGLLVGYARVAAFIATLAVGSAATGVEEALMHGNTLYGGITKTYIDLAQSKIGGVAIEVIIIVVVVAVISLWLAFTVSGRRIYTVGSNEGAARLAGVRTRRVIVLGFAVMGLCAAMAGVMVTAQATSYYPNSGTPYLLPAYTAAFLGFSAIGGRRFHPAATFFGVLFIEVLSTGLAMLNSPPWSTDLAEGVALGVAVLLVRRSSGSQ
jgi:ribose transport system permease protein